mmetsp:Transcript_41900/g.48479  ORF Transcript_41900/g.48479 Transcript_41900/m.48479 type:complete len:248 (-) Transcript_41900:1087-1830(-)
MYGKWQKHQKAKAESRNAEGDDVQLQAAEVQPGNQSKPELEPLIKTPLHTFGTCDLSTEAKSRLKSIIANALFHLRTDKLQANLIMILQLLCRDEKEFLKLQHMSVYEFYFKIICQMYEQSNEFRRALSFEKLFNLINLLNSLWFKYAQKKPELWKMFALDRPDIFKMLFKASYKVIEQGAYPCLCLLAAAFEQPKSSAKRDKEQSAVGSNTEQSDKRPKTDIDSQSVIKDNKDLQDVIMEDEDTRK